MRKSRRIVGNMFDYDLTDPNSAPPSGNNNQGGNTMERNYRASHPDANQRPLRQTQSVPQHLIRPTAQTPVVRKPVRMDITFNDGSSLAFTEQEIDYRNDEYVSVVLPTVSQPPRLIRRFWVHSNADANNGVRCLNDDAMLNRAMEDTNRTFANVETAAAAAFYKDIWFVVDETGAPIKENGLWVEATPEEVANIKASMSAQQPPQAAYTPPPTGNAQP